MDPDTTLSHETHGVPPTPPPPGRAMLELHLSDEAAAEFGDMHVMRGAAAAQVKKARTEMILASMAFEGIARKMEALCHEVAAEVLSPDTLAVIEDKAAQTQTEFDPGAKVLRVSYLSAPLPFPVGDQGDGAE